MEFVSASFGTVDLIVSQAADNLDDPFARLSQSGVCGTILMQDVMDSFEATAERLSVLRAHVAAHSVLIFNITSQVNNQPVAAPSHWVCALVNDGWAASVVHLQGQWVCVANPLGATEEVGRKAIEIAPCHQNQPTLRLPPRLVGQWVSVERDSATLYLINPDEPATFILELPSCYAIVSSNRSSTAVHRLTGENPRFRLILPSGGSELTFAIHGDGDLPAWLQISRGPPANVELSHLAPDLYLRHVQAADLIERLAKGQRLRVLDIGGRNCLLADLLPTHDWRVVDQDYGADHPSFRRMDWLRVSGQYDVVVCIDVLEHIAPQDRPDFLAWFAQMGRFTIVGAPFASLEVCRAEMQLNAFAAALFPDGHRFLSEHKANGLPCLNDTVASLSRTLPQLRVVRGQSLGLWLYTTAIAFLASRMPMGSALAEAYFPAISSITWNSGVPYRHFLIASHETLPEDLGDYREADESIIATHVEMFERLLPLAAIVRNLSDTNQVFDTVRAAIDEISGRQEEVTQLRGELARLQETAAQKAAALQEEVIQLRAEQDRLDEILLNGEERDKLLIQNLRQIEIQVEIIKKMSSENARLNNELARRDETLAESARRSEQQQGIIDRITEENTYFKRKLRESISWLDPESPS